MYGLKNVVALMGGLLLLFQSVAGAAVHVRQDDTVGPLICVRISPLGFPLINDCVAALANVAPIKPEFCTLQFQTEANYKTVGTCAIQTYSYRNGNAGCLDGNLIIKGGKEILRGCTYKEYTGGQYKWSANDNEGVRFARAT
ncbi:hypothetical protein L211DRAFT_866219 [Terfezia boudieri ATCC MYA-4762]|uniref:Cyanovirin-N domain-containing protein n=1 Tax=Terfezia boudieri ATCC MYA-4762 TaxID=1051890 RepID=A0A3N4LV35_9PEZI|nr:hypothetical protein L211DRAFT_866219 [Terfezia boudieri ATCC MYA-4762]